MSDAFSAEIGTIALAVTRELTAERMFDAAARGARRLCGGAAVLGYGLSVSGDEFEVLAADLAPALEPLRAALRSIDAGLVRHAGARGAIALERVELLVPTGETERLPPLGAGLLVPLFSTLGLDGLLLLVETSADRLHADAAPRAEQLARELAPALDNLRAVEALRQLVIRDDTADCFNRRHFDRSLDEEVERARRFDGRFGLIFVDMDNLKEVNTRHGHGAGSRALYEASVRMRHCVRSIDRLFRYGGDEFVILLPGTSLDGAREVAERVRREIAGRPFEMPGAQRLELTASTGVSAWPEHGPDARAVLEASDAAMRAVKSRGKNAVGVAPPRRAADDR